jgi:hypothetical protein
MDTKKYYAKGMTLEEYHRDYFLKNKDKINANRRKTARAYYREYNYINRDRINANRRRNYHDKKNNCYKTDNEIENFNLNYYQIYKSMKTPYEPHTIIKEVKGSFVLDFS